jgi:hypothetical protein
MNPDRYTSRIPLPPRNDLRQLPDGETGLTSIYFTRDGEAFIMLDSPAGGLDRVRREDGVWYGELASPVIRARITGYKSIAAVGDDVAPILLDKADPNLRLDSRYPNN